jgi:hypothetical protein
MKMRHQLCHTLLLLKLYSETLGLSRIGVVQNPCPIYRLAPSYTSAAPMKLAPKNHAFDPLDGRSFGQLSSISPWQELPIFNFTGRPSHAARAVSLESAGIQSGCRRYRISSHRQEF